MDVTNNGVEAIEVKFKNRKNDKTRGKFKIYQMTILKHWF